MLLKRLNSLKLKLLAVLLPGATLALGLAFAITIFKAEEQFQHSLSAKKSNLSNYTDIIADPLWNYDYLRVEKILSSMMLDPDLVQIEVLDESGSTVVKLGTPESADNSIALNFPIIYSNAHISQQAGALNILLAENTLSAQKTSVKNTAIITLLLIFIVMAVGIWMTFHRLLERPIGKLVTAINSYHAGKNSSRIEHQANDELGMIAGAFNEMQQRIESHHSQLQKSQAHLQTLYHSTPSLLFSFDQSGTIRDASEYFLAQLNYSREQVIGKNIADLIPDEGKANIIGNALELLWQRKSLTEYPLNITCGSGKKIEVLMDATLSASQSYPGALAVITDVTSLNQAQRALEHQANTDYLSGIANRYHFQNYLDHLIQERSSSQDPFALLFIDLDHFKSVNDTYGHTTGDELLCMATQRIQSILRPEDKIARLGGDEFAVILNKIDDSDIAEDISRRVIATSEKSFTLEKGDIYISASVGIALFPTDSQTPVGLLQCADLAMYRAKEEGRSCFAFFTPQHNALIQEQLRIENLLRHAIPNNALELHYQPIIDLQSGQVKGMEALLRLKDGDQLIPPDRFIPVAENSGLIVGIGQWCIEESCRQLALWHNQLSSDLYISINVSTRQFQASNFIQSLTDALVKNRIAPNRVLIEITESLLLHDNQHNLEVFDQLCKLGCRIAIDDFGTGFSALSYLMNFPIDTLKIDRAFIQRSTEGSKESGLISAIVQMSLGMEMQVIAEGVEIEAQAVILQTLSNNICAQGYLYARPAPAILFEKHYEELSRRPTCLTGS